MYEQFYGLREKPFALTPNPRFVFQSEQYRVAEEGLLYGIAQKEGFMLVTGAPGTGKTTLCRDLLEKLDPGKHRVALLFNPFLNGVEMLQALLSEFGLGDPTTTSRKELLDLLNTYLLQQLANGRTSIAIFDEAQHLSTEFLEQIRVLSNLETDSEKLIQIILVGQRELLTLIRTPQMAQLDQRVSVRCTLTHLSREETGRYLSHRLMVAGSKGRIRFQEQAVHVLHRATGGVPRLINLTADRSLLAGYSAQRRTIGEPHVRRALASLSGEDGIDATPAAGKLTTARNATWWWRVGGAAAAILLASTLWWKFDGTAEYLAFRASRSPTAVNAERDYERIVLEFPGSRQRENAMLRLAQFQVARGAHAEALTSLETLAREFPNAATGGESYYWTAKALLASGDTTAACAAANQVPAAAGVALTADYMQMTHNCVAFEATARGSDSTGVRRMAPESVP